MRIEHDAQSLLTYDIAISEASSEERKSAPIPFILSNHLFRSEMQCATSNLDFYAPGAPPGASIGGKSDIETATSDTLFFRIFQIAMQKRKNSEIFGRFRP